MHFTELSRKKQNENMIHTWFCCACGNAHVEVKSDWIQYHIVYSGRLL